MQVERAISKSKYISGLQCHKLLWHQYNAKELIPPVDESQQAVFDQGHEVGRRARQLYPGGVLIERERWDMDGLLEDTSRALTAGRAIYEAAFLSRAWLQPRHMPVYAQVDILVPTGDGRWNIVEVKSSTSIKSIYLDDVAVQRFAVESSGTRVRSCYVAHIDRDYVRLGEVENHKLFRVVDVTSDVADRLVDVPGRVEALASVIRQSESPELAIGPHCSRPYACPLKPVCWSAQPEGHLTRVVRGDARRAIQLATAESRNAHVDEPQVRGFIDGLTEGMAIADGATASQSFLRMAFGTEPGDESAVDVAKVRQDLEAYCELDTLAMVRILDAMAGLAVRPSPGRPTTHGQPTTSPPDQGLQFGDPTLRAAQP